MEKNCILHRYSKQDDYRELIQLEMTNRMHDYDYILARRLVKIYAAHIG